MVVASPVEKHYDEVSMLDTNGLNIRVSVVQFRPWEPPFLRLEAPRLEEGAQPRRGGPLGNPAIDFRAMMAACVRE